MTLADLLTASVITNIGPKPRDDELDLFGLTHPGKVRKENQDHFLLGTIHQQVVIHGTSLPDADQMPLRSQRLATIMLVADGVGGGIAGAEASRLAVKEIASYITSAVECYHARGRGAEKEFFEALKTAAMTAHDAVKTESAARAETDPRAGVRSMATTATLGLAVWPWLYVLQLGDSRCYYYWDGHLKQVTRDQTIAQDLVDQGAMPASSLETSPLSHVLASAIGAQKAMPVVSRLNIQNRGCIILLCSDGLTKHVSDEEIAEQCAKMGNCEQLCRVLLDMALERGGSDNISIVAGRAKP